MDELEMIEAIPEEVIAPEEPKALYTVKVTHPSLRKRQAPNTQAEVLGLITDEGYYEIFEEANGWGQLNDKSWIMLSYTNRMY